MAQELYQWKAEGIYIMVMVITQFPQMITYLIIVRCLPFVLIRFTNMFYRVCSGCKPSLAEGQLV